MLKNLHFILTAKETEAASSPFHIPLPR